MKMFGKISALVLSLLIVAAALCGCNQGTADSAISGKNAFGDAEALDEGNYGETEAKANKESVQAEKSRKIIEYIDLTVETKTFDKLIDDINAVVKKSGGYIENSEIGGNGYYDNDTRTAELKVRIPKTAQNDFSDFISKNSNVVNRSVNTEDVTDTYIDVESRIKALKIEKETLEKLLASSKKVSDTLTVYEKLTDVIAEIESYQGRLNQMDNLIEYTTFTINIEEVEKETQVEKQSWFAGTWDDLVDNFSDLWDGLLIFFSFMISALPYWILLGANALAVVLIIRHFKKKRIKRIQEMQKMNNQS